ncbi:DUF6541 family protein [Microbacterium album]|uniref:Uncharacterized protein n=1 Tax=Microbacterium album TaxID=2053191 RepID=A0A917IDB8_9MICO|nr:DUF6541 family protein [Microbacterium album]GGH37556.1 hypothetical protein GCM10010921_07500 [Microbacterium album]
MTWPGALPALLAAAVAVAGPGLLATAPVRAGVLPRVSLAALVGTGLSGGAAAVAGWAGVPFHAWQVWAMASLVAIVIAFVRRRLPRDGIAPTPPLWALGAAWAAGALLLGSVAFAGVPDPDRISQTYDNVFHLSAVSAILDGFSGSPLTLRSLIETEAPGIAYYPAAWHLLVAMTVQLSGATVAVAFNAVWLAVGVLVWLPGVAWLAQAVLPRAFARTAGLIALPLGAAFGSFPYALLAWGTIYPTGLAHALLPASLALTVLAVRSAVAAPSQHRRRGWLVAAGAAALSATALAFAHPRVLPTWVLILVPFATACLAGTFSRAWRRGGRARSRAVAALGAGAVFVASGAGAAFAYAVAVLGLFDEPLEQRLDGPQAQAVQAPLDGVRQVALQQTMTGAGDAVTAAAPLLAAVVVLGLVATLRRARTRWIAVSFLLLAALFVLAAGSDGAVAKLATGVWYKDRFRLAAALPALGVPLAAYGILVVSRAVLRLRGGSPSGRGRRETTIAAVAAAVVAVTSCVTLAFSGTTAAIAGVFTLPAERAQWEIVSQKQIDFMDHVVREVVPEDQRVLGDPWDGSALTQLFAGREPVFPHVNGQWDHHRRVLAWDLPEIHSDPEVCAALDALRVRYVLYNPHEFGGGDPAGNHFPGPHAAIAEGLFTVVATDGESVLYRIDQCGSLPR